VISSVPTVVQPQSTDWSGWAGGISMVPTSDVITITSTPTPKKMTMGAVTLNSQSIRSPLRASQKGCGFERNM